MKKYKLIFTKSAANDLNALVPKTRLRILNSTKTLEDNPFPRGNTIKRIKGAKIPLYRLRVGDYRVIYYIDGKNIPIILIVARKDLEKRLKSLL